DICDLTLWLAKTRAREMAARDGIEPPTPATHYFGIEELFICCPSSFRTGKRVKTKEHRLSRFGKGSSRYIQPQHEFSSLFSWIAIGWQYATRNDCSDLSGFPDFYVFWIVFSGTFAVHELMIGAVGALLATSGMLVIGVQYP